MQPTLCARCKKNMAVVFINRIENGVSHQEGLCLKCARELHIKPIDDIISKMGISDDELESLSSDMMEAMQSLTNSGDGLMEIENNPDNVEAILDAAYSSPALTDVHLLGLLLHS